MLEYTAPTGFRFLGEPMFCFSTLNANTNPNSNPNLAASIVLARPAWAPTLATNTVAKPAWAPTLAANTMAKPAWAPTLATNREVIKPGLDSGLDSGLRVVNMIFVSNSYS